MTVAVIGGGAMGEAVIAGLVRSGREPADVIVVEQRPERAAELAQRYGVATASEVGAVRAAEAVLLVVKPADLPALAEQLGGQLRDGAVVVSLAAGIPTTAIEQRLPAGTPVVRVMPNTPALIGEGMAALSRGAAVTDDQVAAAMDLLSACGQVVEVPEKQQDAVTALSGSGPAYLFYVADALIEAGVVLGLPRATARQLAVQTLYGAAAMLRETDEHPTLLREQVTSPAGTTAAALRVLDAEAVRAAFVSALAAAAERSAELAAAMAR
ncbi:MAG: pyrroline-5-carboxylate reductase [Tetrasphaera sp.]